MYNLGRYRIYAFTGSVPIGLTRNNLKNYPIKGFGHYISNVDFYLGGLNTLPDPLQQKIMLDTDLKSVLKFCVNDKNKACNDEFIRNAANKFLTDNPVLLQQPVWRLLSDLEFYSWTIEEVVKKGYEKPVLE
jgi:hypothetical protein